MKRIGYVLRSQRGIDERLKERVGVGFCSTCGLPTQIGYTDINLPIPRRLCSFDILYTRDLYNIMSGRLLQIIEREAVNEFDRFWVCDDQFALVVPKDKLHFDTRARGTRFLAPCRVCGRYFEVIGATPAFVIEEKIEDFGIYETDLEFGTGVDKAPLTVIGKGLKAALGRARLRGLDFETRLVALLLLDG